MNFYPINEIEEQEADALLKEVLKEKSAKKMVEKLTKIIDEHPLFVDARIQLIFLKEKKQIEKHLIEFLDEYEESLKKASLYDDLKGCFSSLEETKKELEILYYLFSFYFEKGMYDKAIKIAKRNLELDLIDTYNLRYNLLLIYLEQKDFVSLDKGINSLLNDDISTYSLLLKILRNADKTEHLVKLLDTYHPTFKKIILGEIEASEEEIEACSQMISIPFGSKEEDLLSIINLQNSLGEDYEKLILKIFQTKSAD